MASKSRLRRFTAWAATILAAVLVATLTNVFTGALTGAWRGVTAWFTAEEAPFTVVAEVNDNHCGNGWFVQAAPSALEFPLRSIPGSLHWRSYPPAAGGHSASPTSVTLTVQGRTRQTVVLTGLDIEVRKRRPAPKGVVLNDACGDLGAFRWVAVDLDASPPQVTPKFEGFILDMIGKENVPVQNRKPIRFPYHVNSVKPETFLMSAQTVACDCSWVAVLTWQSGDRSGRYVIDDAGSPFRTVGRRNATHTCSSDGRCFREAS